MPSAKTARAKRLLVTECLFIMGRNKLPERRFFIDAAPEGAVHAESGRGQPMGNDIRISWAVNSIVGWLIRAKVQADAIGVV